MRIAKLILSTLLTLFILGCIAVGIVYVQFKSELPDVESLKTVELQQPMQIYTSDGKLIGEVGEQRRIPVKLENIPEKLIQVYPPVHFSLHFFLLIFIIYISVI